MADAHTKCVRTGVYTELTQDACIHAPTKCPQGHTCTLTTQVCISRHLGGVYLWGHTHTDVCGPSQAYTCKYTQLTEVFCARASNPSECIQCACVYRELTENSLISSGSGNAAITVDFCLPCNNQVIHCPSASSQRSIWDSPFLLGSQHGGASLIQRGCSNQH